MNYRFLRTRLTVYFGCLFCIILLAVTAGVFLTVRSGANEQVRKEFAATVNMQQHLWDGSSRQLSETARVAARDFGFRAAVATEDIPTINSALDNFKQRLGLDLAFVVLSDGTPVGIDPVSSDMEDANLGQLSAGQMANSGLMPIGDALFLSVSEPVLAPDPVGTVVFGTKVGAASLRELEALSPIALTAKIITEEDAALNPEDAIISETVLASYFGETSYVLQLSYPMAKALAPYRPMFITIIGATLVGMAVLAIGASAIARTVTRPIAALDNATRSIGQGDTFDLIVEGRDEIARLSRGFMSMAERIKTREAQIVELSRTDPETDLPNRRALLQEISRLQASQTPWSVAAVGIERFETIRDVIGLDACNTMVKLVGESLKRLDDVVAIGRLSPSVIGVLFKGDEPEMLKTRLASYEIGHSRPLSLAQETVDIQLKAGLAGRDGNSAMSPVDTAMTALRQARRSHCDVMLFDAEAFGDPSGTLSLMSEMLKGLADGSVEVHYQPKLNCHSGEVDSAEALVRWQHPKLGRMRPDHFVGVAEETGHIRPLTEFVVDKAIQEQQMAASNGLDLQIAVNLSGRLLTDEGFVTWLIERLGTGTRLSFEITETAVINDFSVAIAQIQRIRNAGYEISIDDYGVGLSSLSYLKQIPATELKIDKAFIQALEAKSADALLVKSTIDLAHGLGMEVTCEGVEDIVVLELLRLMGADHIQGYYVSKPKPMNEVIREYASEERRRAQSLS